MVLPGQDALCERRPDDLRDAGRCASWDHRALGQAPQHRILRLTRDEMLDARHALCGLDLCGRPFAESEIASLAGANDLGQRRHRLLERGRRGRTDGTGRGRRWSVPQPLATMRRSASGPGPARDPDPRHSSGSRASSRARTSRAGDARSTLPRNSSAAPRPYTFAVSMKLSPSSKARSTHASGAVVADPAAEREPGAEADLGDDQVAGTEAAVLHVDRLPLARDGASARSSPPRG